MINRRGFFGFLGASPFAARAAAANVTKNLGINPGVKTIDWGDNQVVGTPNMAMKAKNSDPVGLLNYLMNEGFPEWKLEELKDEVPSRQEHYLEPSIKSLKSVSLTYKTQMQKNKDIETRKNAIIKRLKEAMLPVSPSKILQDKFGFWL